MKSLESRRFFLCVERVTGFFLYEEYVKAHLGIYDHACTVKMWIVDELFLHIDIRVG